MPLCSSCGGDTFIPHVSVDFPGLHNRLRTEYGPASVQRDVVASVLQNIRRDLEDYEAQICHLERLIQEKKRLEQYATQLRSLLSPFRKVPDEILRHIFDDCCEMNSFRVVDRNLRVPTNTPRSLRRKPAMVISSVCSRWRRNALSLPAIWSRVSVRWMMDASRDYCKDEYTEVFFPLSNFLDRSQQYPMTVNLGIKGDPFLLDCSLPDSDLEELHPLLCRLFGQMKRWKDFSFNCDENWDLEQLLGADNIPSASFPVLSTLRTPSCEDEENLIPFIGTAPNLQSLSLGSKLRNVPRGFSYYSQLSHLEFIPHPEHLRNLFGTCPNLISLRITESWQRTIHEDPMMITSSSRLEILTVHFGYNLSTDSSDSVFLSFRLPSLKALHLEPMKLRKHVHGTKSWRNLNSFMAFVQQPLSQLTTFSVQQLAISDSNLVDILVHLPTLQNLIIDDSGISPEYSSISSGFIESLHGYRTSSLRSQEAAIVPRLRSLRLLNVGATTFNDLSVVEMVKSRWIPTRLHDVETSTLEVDCLRVFTMAFLNRSEVEASAGVYSLLAPIEKDGMMVVVRLGHSDHPKV